VAVTDRCELIFDTVDNSRKVMNLRQDPRVAVVVGGTIDDERTVQCHGMAGEPDGPDGDRIREAYFARFADGRERLNWLGITHVRVRPGWLRYSDYNQSPPVILEWVADVAGELRFDSCGIFTACARDISALTGS